MDEPAESEWNPHPWVIEARDRIRFGLVDGPAEDWSALRDFVRMAEDTGFDSLWRADHPMLGIDCWMALAAAAEATSRIRLGSLVSCVHYRNPAVLARMR